MLEIIYNAIIFYNQIFDNLEQNFLLVYFFMVQFQFLGLNFYKYFKVHSILSFNIGAQKLSFKNCFRAPKCTGWLTFFSSAIREKIKNE